MPVCAVLAGQLQAANAANADLRAQLSMLQHEKTQADNARVEEQQRAKHALEQAEARMQATVLEAQRRAAAAEDDARRAVHDRDQVAAQAARDRAAYQAPPVSLPACRVKSC